jgi:hypothetical protein
MWAWDDADAQVCVFFYISFFLCSTNYLQLDYVYRTGNNDDLQPTTTTTNTRNDEWGLESWAPLHVSRQMTSGARTMSLEPNSISIHRHLVASHRDVSVSDTSWALVSSFFLFLFYNANYSAPWPTPNWERTTTMSGTTTYHHQHQHETEWDRSRAEVWFSLIYSLDTCREQERQWVPTTTDTNQTKPVFL